MRGKPKANAEAKAKANNAKAKPTAKPAPQGHSDNNFSDLTAKGIRLGFYHHPFSSRAIS